MVSTRTSCSDRAETVGTSRAKVRVAAPLLMIDILRQLYSAARLSRARAFWSNDWNGESFMAIGLRDTVLGEDVMEDLRSVIRGCPPPMKIPEAGHFVQEYGEPIARAALEQFKLG